MKKHPDISFDDLADYVFEQLSPEQEIILEDLLDDHEDYRSMVDALLDFCLQNGIKNKEALNLALEKQDVSLLNQIKAKSNVRPPAKRNRSVRLFRLSGIAATFLLLFAGIWWWQQSSAWETVAILDQEVTIHRNILQYASVNDWEYWLAKGEYEKALSMLKRSNEESSVDQLFDKRAYFQGVMMLYLHHDDPAKLKQALVYLEQGREFDIERTNQHLISAYILLGKKEEVQDLINETDFDVTKLDPTLQQLYLQLNE